MLGLTEIAKAFIGNKVSGNTGKMAEQAAISSGIIRKREFIKDLKKDDIVNDVFVVKFKKPVEAYKNGFKFELRLGDSSREIMYKYWGPQDEAKVRALYDSISPDSIVLVQGRVSAWKEQIDISANDPNTVKTLAKGEYDPGDFVRVSSKPIDVMYSNLLSYIDSIKSEDMKNLLNYFFSDEKFSREFMESPAAMYIHHGWVGGLIEHTLSVAGICEDILKTHDKLDRDLLITGALLHDIGKIEEFCVTTSIKVTTKGMIWGHVTIGVEMLIRAMDKLKTPNELRLKIIHMMITHMGEYGSNKTPAFPEALALFHADHLDAKLLQMTTIKDETTTEDDYVYTKEFGN